MRVNSVNMYGTTEQLNDVTVEEYCREWKCGGIMMLVWVWRQQIRWRIRQSSTVSGMPFTSLRSKGTIKVLIRSRQRMINTDRIQ